jgi:hypothetical protein
VAVSESRDYVHKVVLNGQVKDNCRWYLNWVTQAGVACRLTVYLAFDE